MIKCSTCQMPTIKREIQWLDEDTPRCYACRNQARKKPMEATSVYQRNAKIKAYYSELDFTIEPSTDLATKIKRLWNRYGLTYEQYYVHLKKYQGMCHICRIKPGVAVDHCHITGKVRGVLCSMCNTGIGNLRDDIKLLESAIQYLRDNQGCVFWRMRHPADLLVPDMIDTYRQYCLDYVGSQSITSFKFPIIVAIAINEEEYQVSAGHCRIEIKYHIDQTAYGLNYKSYRLLSCYEDESRNYKDCGQPIHLGTKIPLTILVGLYGGGCGSIG